MALLSPGHLPVDRAVKIVVAGGFQAGKTTFVVSASDVVLVRTDAPTDGSGIGSPPRYLTGRTTTTVALDLGRVSLPQAPALYLCATPGQERFWFMWPEVVDGAAGALVIVDSRHLAGCYGSLDFFESAGVPFIVVINAFDGSLPHDLASVRKALRVSADVPIIACDARAKRDCLAALTTLVAQATTIGQAASAADRTMSSRM